MLIRILYLKAACTYFHKVQAALNVIEAYSSFIGLVSNFVHSVWDITDLLLRR